VYGNYHRDSAVCAQWHPRFPLGTHMGLCGANYNLWFLHLTKVQVSKRWTQGVPGSACLVRDAQSEGITCAGGSVAQWDGFPTR
jgi:hypothetical protein